VKNRTVKFVVMTNEDDETAMDEATARKLGIVDDTTLQAVFEDRAAWHSVELLPATARIEGQINRETYVLDPVLGARKDETLLPQKRAANVIQSWTGFPKNFSEEAYLDLSPNVAKFLDEVVLQRLYPSAFQNPDFFGTWSRLQAGSGSGNGSPTPNSTKES